jgi:putative flippase GtrA
MMVKVVKKLIDYTFGKGLGGETLRYLIVGVLTTLVNFGMFELMSGVMKIDVTVSNVTSIAVSILFAYVTNKLIVFRWRSDSLIALALEFVRFIGSRLFTMALEVGAVLLLHNTLGIDPRLAKASSLILVIIANYILSKVIVFRKIVK